MPLEAPPGGTNDWVGLTTEPLSGPEFEAWATVPGAGAVVAFLGVVRDHAEGRDGVVGMTYEAYEGPARARLEEIAGEVRVRWPDVARLVLVHRLGELALGEASVAVVVSSPHRGTAFEACRFAIDTLKQTVPIWKKEHWPDGSDWALGASPIRAVGT